MQVVIVVLFLVRDLGLSTALVGLVIAVAEVAGIAGAIIGVQITGRLGNGPAFIVGMTLSSLAGLVMAAAGGPTALVIAVVIIGQLLRGWGPTLYGINQQTIRQILIAPELLARTQATWRFLVHGMQPIGGCWRSTGSPRPCRGDAGASADELGADRTRRLRLRRPPRHQLVPGCAGLGSSRGHRDRAGPGCVAAIRPGSRMTATNAGSQMSRGRSTSQIPCAICRLPLLMSKAQGLIRGLASFRSASISLI